MTKPLTIGKPTTIKGGEIQGSSELGYSNLVDVTVDGVKFDGVTFRTAPEGKNALHVYQVGATINNVTIDNSDTAGGAPIIVTGDLTVEGTLDITLGKNSWYAINVDAKYKDVTVTFAEGSKLAVHGNEDNPLVLFVENSDKHKVTLNGLEGVGLVDAGEGKYVFKESA